MGQCSRSTLSIEILSLIYKNRKFICFVNLLDDSFPFIYNSMDSMFSLCSFIFSLYPWTWMKYGTKKMVALHHRLWRAWSPLISLYSFFTDSPCNTSPSSTYLPCFPYNPCVLHMMHLHTTSWNIGCLLLGLEVSVCFCEITWVLTWVFPSCFYWGFSLLLKGSKCQNVCIIWICFM